MISNIIFGLFLMVQPILSNTSHFLPADPITVYPYKAERSESGNYYWLYYKVTNDLYKDGIIPHSYHFITKDPCEYIDGEYWDKTRSPIFRVEDKRDTSHNKYYLWDNMFNKELYVMVQYKGTEIPKDFRSIALTCNGTFFPEVRAKKRRYIEDIISINGVVGWSYFKEDDTQGGCIRIADNHKKINEVVIQIKMVAEYYDYTINGIELISGY